MIIHRQFAGALAKAREGLDDENKVAVWNGIVHAVAYELADDDEYFDAEAFISDVHKRVEYAKLVGLKRKFERKLFDTSGAINELMMKIALPGKEISSPFNPELPDL